MIDIRKNYAIQEFDQRVIELLKDINKKSPLILVQGGYGKNNLGDDALLLTIAKKIEKWIPGATIVAMCHYPERVEQLYHLKAVGFKSIHTTKYLCTCDVLIIGGGGIVNIINTFSGFPVLKIFDMKGKFLFLTSLFTKLRRKKVIFYGVGMTSIPDRFVKILMNITVKKIDLLGVRDKVSKEKVKEIIGQQTNKLFYTYDPALDFTVSDEPLEPVIKAYSICTKCNIIINIRSVLDEEINQRVMKEIVPFLIRLHKKYPQFQLILLPVSIHPDKMIENDLIICKKLYEMLVGQGVSNLVLLDSYLHPGVTKKLLERTSLLIMSRLHGLILSCDFRIPTIVLSYDDKVKLFAEMAGYRYIFEYQSLSETELWHSAQVILGENQNEEQKDHPI